MRVRVPPRVFCDAGFMPWNTDCLLVVTRCLCFSVHCSTWHLEQFTATAIVVLRTTKSIHLSAAVNSAGNPLPDIMRRFATCENPVRPTRLALIALVASAMLGRPNAWSTRDKAQVRLFCVFKEPCFSFVCAISPCPCQFATVSLPEWLRGWT